MEKEQDMTPQMRDELEKQNKLYCCKGETVIGLSYLKLDPIKFPENFQFKSERKDFNIPNSQLVFLGLISLNDPFREKAIESIEKCTIAGIKVIMITGDQMETAKAIACKAKLLTELDQEFGNLLEKGAKRETALRDCKVMYQYIYIGCNSTRR